MKLRTTALAAAVIAASVPCLSASVQAAPFVHGMGWHAGIGRWHGGDGWHDRWGGGWAGAGLGFAAGAIVGSALAAPYYDGGYYTADYDYPDYYGYASVPAAYGYDYPAAYGYDYAPVGYSYDYAVAPSYDYDYGPAYASYSAAVQPRWRYRHRQYERYGYERSNRGGIYASYGTSRHARLGTSFRGEYRTGRTAIRAENRRPIYAQYQGHAHSVANHMTVGTGVSRANAAVGVGHMKAGAGHMAGEHRH
jgi:hypothetical protein